MSDIPSDIDQIASDIVRADYRGEDEPDFEFYRAIALEANQKRISQLEAELSQETEMSEIPEDIKKAAATALLQAGHSVRIGDESHKSIGRAILAERERCAKIAESFLPGGDNYDYDGVSVYDVAEAIRGTPYP